MNREILFKAKRINWKELPEKEWWIEGIPFEIEYDEKYVMLIKDQENQIRPPYVSSCMSVAEIYAIEIDPDTICQYTGLTDKNGKKIWENDIVNCIAEECCGYISWNESESGFYFCVLLEDGCYEEEHIYDYVDELEVIGNIFDNPELLSGGSVGVN